MCSAFKSFSFQGISFERTGWFSNYLNLVLQKVVQCKSPARIFLAILQLALVGESLCCHNVCMVVGQSGGGQFIIHSLTFRLDWTLGPPQVSTPTHNHYIGGVEDFKVVFDSPCISHEINGAASQSLKLMWNCWAEVLQTSKSRFVLSPRTLYDYTSLRLLVGAKPARRRSPHYLYFKRRKKILVRNHF